MSRKALLSWSSGKDSAWALKTLREDPRINLAGLFTVVNETYGRVAMHSTRLALLRRQAASAGLPLSVINIPYPCDNERYASIMRGFIEDSLANGVELMAFGDLFLEDVRRYREDQLSGTGVTPIFPLWDIPTRTLAEQMFSAGVKAYVSCVDPRKVPAAMAGRQWSRRMIDELPDGADPCGENGEFHTVVVDGPFFRSPIPVKIGETVERDGFVFADIVPDGDEGTDGGGAPLE